MIKERYDWNIDLKKVLKSDLIKKFMQDNKLSHKQFAKMCDISVSTLYFFLNGGNVRLRVIYKVSRAMGVKGDDLINREAIIYHQKEKANEKRKTRSIYERIGQS